jgi:hypothetical protein
MNTKSFAFLASPKVVRALRSAWLAMLVSIILLEVVRALRVIPLGSENFLAREAKHNMLTLVTCGAFLIVSTLIVLAYHAAHPRAMPAPAGPSEEPTT